MPFEGASIPAPIMAAKQGMRDIQLHGVSDQAKTVVKYVSGALTGQGSGLLQPSTQSAQGPMQSSQSLTAQSGQAMTIGKSEFWGLGQTAGSSGDGWASTLGQVAPGAAGAVQGALGQAGGGIGGLASAQSLMGQSSGALGSAAALAGSTLGAAGPGGPVGSSSASAGASAMSPSGSSSSTPFSGLAPGSKPTPPQFNPLPAIPSLPRLQDVIARLGAMAGPAAPLVGMLAGGAGGDDTGSGMQQQPANQFAGAGPAANYQADS